MTARAWEYRYRAMRSDKPRKRGDDGDTVLMLLDQGLNHRAEEAIRLAGVHAPELSQFGGAEAARMVDLVLDEVTERMAAHRERWAFRVVTVPVLGDFEASESRSFVRYAAHVWAIDTGEYLNKTIIDLLAQHPEWGGGIGAAEARANG